MKDSKAYLEAAKLIHEHKEKYSCFALGILDELNDFWEPTPLSRSFGWDTGFDEEWMNAAEPNEARRIRVLLLCLMSAKAKMEGR